MTTEAARGGASEVRGGEGGEMGTGGADGVVGVGPFKDGSRKSGPSGGGARGLISDTSAER